PLTITLPAHATRTHPVFALDGAAIAPSPNYVAVLDVPTLDETAAKAAPPVSPFAIHGVLGEPGETDTYRLRAKSGEALDIRVLARRLRSPLDMVLTILDDKGTALASNDDAAGADPELRWTAPADGEFQLQVRDHRGRGGPALVYRLEVEQPRPGVSAALERIDARRPQLLQSICVPRGNTFAVMMRAERRDASGEVKFSMPELPPGVSLVAPAVPGELGSAPMVFAASADAPLEGGLYPVTATLGDSLVGGFTQQMPLVLGPPNDTVYYQTVLDRLAVAVTEAAPFKVRLVAPTAPLVRTGGKSLRVVVERQEGFAGDVTVQMLWNPPGVTSGSSITVPGAASEGVYPLNASGDAPLKSWQVGLTARAAVGGSEVWVGSPLVELAVADAIARGTLKMAAAEQGSTALVVCDLEPVRPFEGRATVRLGGLPPNAACAPKEISSADTSIVFEVTTTDATPVGQHKSLYCDLELKAGEEIVAQRLASNGVLRIDKPAPASAPVPAATVESVAPAAAAPAPPKPLSRLEQIRKKAKGAAPGGNP
ncbi:MAG: PPC domain-containing protein, partial [Phycisphaerales bacterium]